MTTDKQKGVLVQGLLRMVKGAGFYPDFDEMNEDEATNLLTAGSELMRMIRDGDPNSTNELAARVYGKLITGD